jgi:dienelactone hydrolase
MKHTEAPRGDIATFAREEFTHRGETRAIYRKGTGPAVLVIAEIPGLTPHVLGFADRIAAIGCSAVLPQLFGTPGRDPMQGNPLAGGWYGLQTAMRVCISREFTTLALGRSSPVVTWLRALGEAEHARCKGGTGPPAAKSRGREIVKGFAGRREARPDRNCSGR